MQGGQVHGGADSPPGSDGEAGPKGPFPSTRKIWALTAAFSGVLPNEKSVTN